MSSSSSSRRKLLQNPVAVNIDCSCRRRGTTDFSLSHIFWPKPKPKFSKKHPKSDLYQSSSSTSLEPSTGDSNPTFSPSFSEPEVEHPIATTTSTSSSLSKPVKGFDRIGESVAVVKDSNDPYLDFRHSMLQMILEKEMYTREDLRELLHCFLSLNSPYHHEIIVQAFTEIWHGVFSIDYSSRVWRKSREFLV